MKTNPKDYLLYTLYQRKMFEERLGANLPAALKSVACYIKNMPEGIWCNYLRGVPEKNIPIIVGCLCIWMDDNKDKSVYVSFNDSITMIKKIVWIEPQLPEE